MAIAVAVILWKANAVAEDLADIAAGASSSCVEFRALGSARATVD